VGVLLYAVGLFGVGVAATIACTAAWLWPGVE
jgi:hypothetical protein